MNKNLKSVIRTYEKKGIVHEVKGKDVVHAARLGESGAPVIQRVSTSKESIAIYTIAPLTIGETDIPVASMMIMRVNNGLRLGSFFIDEEGTVVFRSGIFTGKHAVDSKELMFHLTMGAFLVDNYLGEFKGCCSSPSYGKAPMYG